MFTRREDHKQIMNMNNQDQGTAPTVICELVLSQRLILDKEEEENETGHGDEEFPLDMQALKCIKDPGMCIC